MKADINALDKLGRTTLHTGVIRMCTEMQAILQEVGEDDAAEAVDEAETVFIEYKLIVKELLFNGANRNIKNAQGKTAFEII